VPYTKSPLTLGTALSVLALLFAAAFWWPTSFWLDYKSVAIDTVRVGEPITMTADREVVRPFLGTWTATVKEWNGGWESRTCAGNGKTIYTPDSKLPNNLTLAWWMGQTCAELPAGKYKVITTWVIDLPAPIPNKRVTIESNVFEVRP
jgi:hypothetical protein